MFKRKTVFVVGAGASHELGFPLGVTLRDQMATQALETAESWVQGGGPYLSAALSSGVPEINTNLQAKLKAFASGLATRQSIDTYLDFHQGDDEIIGLGKFAIAYRILEAERYSTLGEATANGTRLLGLSNTYLPKLFSAMSEGTQRNAPERIFENISFICFNYDRSIEAYMFYAVRALLGCSDEEARNVCSQLRVRHPYGSVGPLWTQSAENRPPDLMYGRNEQYQPGQVWRAIRTFTEKTHDPEELDAIHLELAEAYRIVFMGFSFLGQNIKLLAPPTPTRPNEIIGTSYGMSDFDQQITRAEMAQAFKGPTGEPARLELLTQTASEFLSSTANYLRA